MHDKIACILFLRRPFVQGALYGGGDEGVARVAELLREAGTDAARLAALRAAVPVELASQPVLEGDWVGCAA